MLKKVLGLLFCSIFILSLYTCSGVSADDASLSSLTISVGTLTPTFNKETLSYVARVPITTYSVTVTATATASINALINVNGLPAISGKESAAVTLTAGDNLIEIKVKSANRDKTLTYVVNVTKSISDLEAIIRGNDTGNSDKFGWSIACDGTTLVVGAPGAPGGSGPGAVYVFNKSSSGWGQTQKLTASGGSTGDLFGWSVALDNNTIAVGAPHKDYDGTDVNSGAVYIFTESGNTWSQQAMKESSDPCFAYYFGWSVSLNGGTLAVGEPDSALSGTACSHGPIGGGYYGTVHIFTGSGASWTHQAALQATDSAPNSYFGESNSMDSETLAVGARGDLSAGSVYIFTGASNSWAQQAKLRAASPSINANFGYSVSLSGFRLVIGAPNESTSAPNSGATYLFSGSGATWQQAGNAIKAATPTANDYLGSSVNINGNIFVLGAPGAQTPAKVGSIAVYAKKDLFVWSQVGDPLVPTETTFARFGQSVAVTDTELFIGADNYDGDGSGAVYIYH